MATIKSYTDLEQSKKLANILPLESADMLWGYYYNGKNHCVPNIRPFRDGRNEIPKGYTPAWSLAALLDVLPNNEHVTTTLSRGGWKIEPVEYIDKWFCEYEDEVDKDSPCREFTVSADNQVDACVAMIEKLHELKML